MLLHVTFSFKAESGGQSGGSTGTSNTSLAMYENLQANLSDDFTKKMEKWDRKKTRKGICWFLAHSFEERRVSYSSRAD